MSEIKNKEKKDVVKKTSLKESIDNIIGKLVKYQNITTPKDKFFRLWQYSVKIILYHLETSKSYPELLPKLNGLAGALSNGRRMWRFGKWAHAYQGFFKAFEAQDNVIKIISILRGIFAFFFNICDTLCWFGKIKLVPSLDAAYWGQMGCWFWFLGSFFGAILDMYKLSISYIKESELKKQIKFYKIQTNSLDEITKNTNTSSSSASSSSSSSNDKMQLSEKKIKEMELIERQMEVIRSTRIRTIQDFYKNFFDLAPAYEASYKNGTFNKGVCAYGGTIASAIGLYMTLPK